MKLLAAEFSASNYDIKHLIRCICNSKAYQRTSAWSMAGDDQARKALTMSFGRMPVRLMTADVLFQTLRQVYGDDKLDLRTDVKHSKVGMAAPVGDAWLEFQRRFGTNEEDPTDFTHGIAQMLTMINHPRLLQNSKLLDEFLKKHPKHDAKQIVNWLYLSTLSRHASDIESKEALQYIKAVDKPEKAYIGILWTLVNRSEFLLVR